MISLLRADCNNFKSYRGKHSFVLDLKPGLYYVTGKNKLNPRMGANGVGKSTMFDLIYWVLTGELLAVKAVGDSVVPWGADTKKMWGKLWFEIDGQLYGLRRQRKPNGLWLQEGAEGEPKEIDQSRVRELIGLSNEALRRTIILGQFSTLFMDLPASEQSAMFSEILPLEIWVKAAAKAQQLVTEGNRALADDRNTLARLEGRYDGLYAEWERASTNKTTWVTDHERRLDAAKAALATAEEDLRKADRKLEGAEDPADLQAAIADEQEAVRIKSGNLIRLNGEHNTTKAELRRKRQDKDDTDAELRRFNAAMEASVCPECGQQVKGNHMADKVKALNDKLARLQREIDTLAADEAGQRGKIDDADREVEEAEKAITPKRAKLQACTGAYREVSEARASAARAADRADAELQRVEAEVNPNIANEKRLKTDLRTLANQTKEAEDRVRSGESAIEANTLAASYFKEIRLSLIDETLQELEVTANQNAEELGAVGWRIKFVTERVNKAGNTSVGLTTLVYPPDGSDPVRWELFSGGERQRLQLAVTFGLSEVLLGRARLQSNVEVLDEPTKGMSAEGIADLIDHLTDRARLRKKAILLVDQHPLDRGLFAKVFQVTMDQGGSRMEVL